MLVAPNYESIEKTAVHSWAYIMEIPPCGLRLEKSQPQLLIFGPACLCDEGNRNQGEATKHRCDGAVGVQQDGPTGHPRLIFANNTIPRLKGGVVRLFRLERMTESQLGCQRRNEKPELAAKSCFFMTAAS